MFIVLLKFSSERGRARDLMEDHQAWVRRGFDEGVFLAVGSLQEKAGGAVVAHGTSLSELKARVQADPFVAEGVVEAEVYEVTPSRVEERLAFLASQSLG